MRHYFRIGLLMLLLSRAGYAQQYKYLVMKGGGIRGIAYAGALEVLENRHITPGIEKVAGTSVGAIVGTLFCMGYKAREIDTIMLGLHIQSFNDGHWFFIGGEKRMRKKFGWFRGEKLEKWLGKLILEKTGNENTTFLQLHQLALKNQDYKDFYVTASNLSKQRLEVFSWETYPNLSIKTAVRASASIPLYYRAVFIDSDGHVADEPMDTGNYNVFVDGGLLNNFPITLFNEKSDGDGINKYTLGLKLDRPEQIKYYQERPGLAPYPIRSFNNYLGALYTLALEQLTKSVPYPLESKQTIYISHSNISPKVRRINRKEKIQLFENGKNAAEAFFRGTHG